MNFINVKDYAQLSQHAAQIVLQQINSKPDSILGLPTGSTPVGMYQLLVQACKEGKADFSKVMTFNLDEYVALPKESTQSYHSFMFENLFSHINIPKGNIHIPNGIAADLTQECIAYDAAIQAMGGIDLQVLGTGVNGHIGFNEPDAVLHKNTHITGLTQQTVESNSIYFDKPEDMPTLAITMGLGSIFSARKILMLASGKGKASVIRRLFKGEITTEAPLTLLALHPDVTVIVDEEAASFLS